MKLIIGGLIGFVLIIVLVIGVLKMTKSRPANPYAISPKNAPVRDETDLRRALEIAADEITAKAPMELDKEIRLDRAFAGPGAHLTYYYSLPNYASGEVDSRNLRKVADPLLKRQLCADTVIKKSMNMGATFIFVIRANNGMEVLRSEMTKSAC